MTAGELIEILQQQDPAAVVVLRWDWDPNDPAVALTCEELAQHRSALHRVDQHKHQRPFGGHQADKARRTHGTTQPAGYVNAEC